MRHSKHEHEEEHNHAHEKRPRWAWLKAKLNNIHPQERLALAVVAPTLLIWCFVPGMITKNEAIPSPACHTSLYARQQDAVRRSCPTAR